MNNAPPWVSVIVVNYNGAHYLTTCLDALSAQTYPAERLEIIVADNGSTDTSRDLVTTAYPGVLFLENGANLGFTGGNNAAIRRARGELVVLLNNDTAPDSAWLEGLVATALAHPEAGAVTGHSRLFYDQVTLTWETETIQVPGDPRPLGIRCYQVETGLPGGVVQYLEGFHGRESAPSGEGFRWSAGAARLGIPVPPGEGDWGIRLRLAAGVGDGFPQRLRIGVPQGARVEWTLPSGEPREYGLTIPAAARREARPLVQNAGSQVFKTGAGRDRGTYVRNFEMFFEEDRGQYARVEEVFSGCGANLLLRRTMLDDVGLLDEDFFMYYEDTDLCWRARLRGWKVLYAPQAVIRHIHCGTSQKWSPQFVLYTDRNRLAMLFKNSDWSIIAREWSHYLGKVAYRSLCAAAGRTLRGRGRALPPYEGAQRRAAGELLCRLPRLWSQRRAIQRSRRVPRAAIRAWLSEPAAS